MVTPTAITAKAKTAMVIFAGLSVKRSSNSQTLKMMLADLIRRSSPLAGPSAARERRLLRAPLQDLFGFRCIAMGVVTLRGVTPPSQSSCRSSARSMASARDATPSFW